MKTILPRCFGVIENKVPIDYWSCKYLGTEAFEQIWFDHTLVRDQCINNLQIGKLREYSSAFFTTFTYLGENYRIIFDHSGSNLANEESSSEDGPIDMGPLDVFDPMPLNEENKIRHRNMIISTLRSDELIPFYSWSFPFEDHENNQTLFVSLKDLYTSPIIVG